MNTEHAHDALFRATIAGLDLIDRAIDNVIKARETPKRETSEDITEIESEEQD